MFLGINFTKSIRGKPVCLVDGHRYNLTYGDPNGYGRSMWRCYKHRNWNCRASLIIIDGIKFNRNEHNHASVNEDMNE